jgi:hypothetical protein
MMVAKADAHTVALQLPERTLAQLDTLVRDGHFANRQAAFARLCGALHLGTTRQSLGDAEIDRLAWESGQS